MFERYDEGAKQALFFARVETSMLGSPSIESEHLLLGLLRVGKGVANQVFDRLRLPHSAVYREIERRTAVRPPVSVAIEIPFSDGVKRSLMAAAEESELLKDEHIGTEHLLLGLLREPGSVAGSVLASQGLQLDGVRREIVNLRRESESAPSRGRSPS